MTPREDHRLHLEQLHELMRQGKGEDQEADDIRERMGDLWWKLTDAERKEMEEYSLYLYKRDGM